MSSQKTHRIAVIGAGSWGTALASLLAQNGNTVDLIGRDTQAMQEIAHDRCNRKYLPDHILSHLISPTAEMATAQEADIILLVIPTSAFRKTCEDLADLGIAQHVPLISCSKGIERNTGERMSEIVADSFPDNPLAVLSGPNHAEEVCKGLATCAVVASEDQNVALQLQSIFSNHYFRCYTQNDIAGIELGGAIKNVFAIAAGISEGLGLGDNASSALVTRGLAEMIRLGTAMGGKMETFVGLSGIGDLIAGCYSHHSRNNRVGQLIGSGLSREEAVDSLNMIAEGVPNTLSIYEVAKKLGVRAPLIDSVYQILFEEKNATEVLNDLFNRDHKHEQA